MLTSDPRLTSLAQELRDIAAAKAACLETVRRFSELLLGGIQRALDALCAQWPQLDSTVTQTTPLAGGLRSFAFEWQGDRVIIAPVQVAAPPNPESRALVPPFNQIRDVVGRVVVFLQPLGVRDVASPVAEIYVHPQGRWFAEGLGGPTGAVALDDGEVSAFAVTLLEKLTHNIIRQHQGLEETTFDAESQGVREPIGFSPGGERPE